MPMYSKDFVTLPYSLGVGVKLSCPLTFRGLLFVRFDQNILFKEYSEFKYVFRRIVWVFTVQVQLPFLKTKHFIKLTYVVK